MGITTKELAKICGVSRTTIHRALSDTGRISQETKEMILKTAEEYEYRPDLLARGLVKGQTYHIGVIVMDVNNRYFSQMLSAIEVEARKQGYFINIALHEKNKQMEKEQVVRLADYHVDGMILSSIHKGETYKKFLESLHTPIVTIDNKIAEGIPFVGIKAREITSGATRKILKKAYDRVVFVCPPLADRENENIYVHEERFLGYKEALKECSKAPFVIETMNYCQKAYEYICAAKQDGERIAFLCAGDMFALEVMKYLKTKNLKTPLDYGIMGYDNIDTLQYVTPKLATIDNSVEEVATTATRLLFDLIHENQVQTERILDAVLVEGETI